MCLNLLKTTNVMYSQYRLFVYKGVFLRSLWIQNRSCENMATIDWLENSLQTTELMLMIWCLYQEVHKSWDYQTISYT